MCRWADRLWWPSQWTRHVLASLARLLLVQMYAGGRSLSTLTISASCILVSLNHPRAHLCLRDKDAYLSQPGAVIPRFLLCAPLTLCPHGTSMRYNAASFLELRMWKRTRAGHGSHGIFRPCDRLSVCVNAQPGFWGLCIRPLDLVIVHPLRKEGPTLKCWPRHASEHDS